MSDKKYVAHTVTQDGKIVKTQSLEEHLKNTAQMASGFAVPFGMENEARAAGALHDIGKVSREFQNRILKGGSRCDHSTAGGIVAATTLSRADIGMCIMGHHGGVPDCGTRMDSSKESTFCGRLKKENLPDYSDWTKLDIKEFIKKLALPDSNLTAIDHYLRIRLLFSALTDADFCDTEKFCKGEVKRGIDAQVTGLADALERYIADNGFDSQTDGINGIRSEISNSAKSAAEGTQGVYSLTVPTGSGKTISSLRFALNHASKHGLKRVIYVIPYVNIIEQTADTFRNILGAQNVLEHHAEVSFKDADENSETEPQNALKLAAENWDAPVIVTTAVQFFESLFSNRPSRSRKIHNISDAVIIYDEVQMLPVKNWLPLVSIIESIAKNTRATQLLCTATQPAIEFPRGTPIIEIAQDPVRYQDELKRVTFLNIGRIEKEAIVEKLCGHEQSLCIVNTKKTAKELFDMLPRDNCNFHLSTNMVPVHRRKVLAEIKDRLKSGKKVRLVATSLVEAGVDLDFEYVMREVAGLDSVLQAAGRCNRNGKRNADESFTEVFELSARVHPSIEQQTQAGKIIMKKYDNWQSMEAIEKYFKRWRTAKGKANLDKDNILKKIEDKLHREISGKFKMIDSATNTIYVPYDETAKSLIGRLHKHEFTKDLFRELSPYSIEVYDKQLAELKEVGAIENIFGNDDILLLCAYGDWYNENTGLNIGNGAAIFLP